MTLDRIDQVRTPRHGRVVDLWREGWASLIEKISAIMHSHGSVVEAVGSGVKTAGIDPEDRFLDETRDIGWRNICLKEGPLLERRDGMGPSSRIELGLSKSLSLDLPDESGFTGDVRTEFQNG